jgi:hypothetical protein
LLRESYYSRLSRYLHLNPIRIQAIRASGIEERQHSLRQFKWSSYPGYLGIAPKPKWLDGA